MKRIGPELKMPKLRGGEVKVPPFLSDLYADLRDRRLLPLVGLILVAIVATPILLAGGSDEMEAAPAPGPVAGTEAGASASSLTVVKAEPGLRNYKKRLNHRSPTDPFKQRFDGPRLGGGGLNEPTTVPTPEGDSGSGGGSGGSEPASTPEPSGGGGGGGGGLPSSGGSGGQSTPSEPTKGSNLYTLAVTVQVTRIETKPDGSLDKKGPTVYKEVLGPTPLPGQKTPVITYLGMGAKHHEPLFLVSTEVTSIFGEANCVSGAASCQLLVLEEGFPVTFVYGDNDVRYKINLIKATPVINGHS